jgi:hypothetical protein
MTDKISEMLENKAPYPYWKPDYDKEMRGYTVYYREDGWPKDTEDTADGYRVFMIMCNIFANESTTRMQVLEQLKNATEENPIKMGGEIFWCEKD